MLDRYERIRGRRYFLLERLAPPPSERWLVYDTVGGGQPRLLLSLPTDGATTQHIRVLRRIESTSLPRILDFESKGDKVRVIVPWVHGIDARAYLERIQAGKVQAPEPYHAIRLTLELAQGLRSLHCHARTIHGDIKPSNLIVTRKSSHLRMIDFGSAWPIEMTGFRNRGDGMSPIYAAPEAHRDNNIDERADQFSATVVLYEFLTGNVPYDGLGGKAGLPQLRLDDNTLVRPSSIAHSSKFLPAKLWRQIDTVVAKGLSLNRADRYAHSGQWVDALEALYLQLRLQRIPQTGTSFWDRICSWLGQKLPSPLTDRDLQ